MTVTRKSTRQAAIDEDIFIGAYGTATGGGTLTIIDTSGALGSVGDAVSKYASARTYRPAAANAADYYRRVNPDGYAPATQTLTVGLPVWTVNPLASGDSGYFEVWPYDLRAINRAFSRALTRQCFTIEREDIVTTGGTLYDFSAAPFSAITPLTSVLDQILKIETITGTDPTSWTKDVNRAGQSWWPENDGAAVKIRFSVPPTGTLRVTWRKHYVDVTDETTTIAIDQSWLKWATMFEFYKSANHRAEGRSESPAAYESLEMYCAQQMDVSRKKFMETYGGQTISQPPKWRSNASPPRMGRRSGSHELYASRNTISP